MMSLSQQFWRAAFAEARDLSLAEDERQKEYGEHLDKGEINQSLMMLREEINKLKINVIKVCKNARHESLLHARPT